ncbi:META domain-containing protein [Dyadobacter sp. CY323]|uniref:META domain-containing protein n=1 Tax=Dyadobacter sp. CY323 TaxID=2907302 RepID=UPI001F1F3C3C|nr:META domain-containing protein [Dyadobacter sp. CY323]MCE6990651.1 META domain-containing protein [Dyadobacter sp. CY323]
MRKIGYYLIVTILLAFSAFQCREAQDCCVPPCSEKSTLTGTWRLSAIENLASGTSEPDPDPNGKGVIFTFTDDEKEGAITGHTFVNQVDGSYSLAAECAIVIKEFGGTKVGEPKWSGRAWLASGKGSYQLAGDKLTLFLNDRETGLVFTRVK